MVDLIQYYMLALVKCTLKYIIETISLTDMICAKVQHHIIGASQAYIAHDFEPIGHMCHLFSFFCLCVKVQLHMGAKIYIFLISVQHIVGAHGLAPLTV